MRLLTIGRTSGWGRTVLLSALVVGGDRIVLVVSKGGDDRNPDWFRHLLAHPDVELAFHGQRRGAYASRRLNRGG